MSDTRATPTAGISEQDFNALVDACAETHRLCLDPVIEEDWEPRLAAAVDAKNALMVAIAEHAENTRRLAALERAKDERRLMCDGFRIYVSAEIFDSLTEAADYIIEQEGGG